MRNYDYLPGDSDSLKSEIARLDAKIRELEAELVAERVVTYAAHEFIAGRITIEELIETVNQGECDE
jgi:hypothetical protein